MEHLYRLAVDTALQSPSKKKVGAVLLRKNRVIATAVNQETKSHPVQAHWAQRVGRPQKIFLHAELSALIKAKEQADKIIVVRVGGNNYSELRMSKPCPVCSAYLRECGVKHIHYSVSNNKFSYEYWE